MDFYIGWSHSDARYSDTFHGCPMLISAVPDNRRPLRKFTTYPSKLIVDSGAIYYSNRGETYRVRDVFDTQLETVQDATSSMQIQLVHADAPLLNKKSLSEQYQAMEKTLFNAYEYMNLYVKAALPPNVRPMGVIQGFDLPSIQYCVHELKKIGYKSFGIGSLLSKNAQQQMQFIDHAVQLVGSQDLHVFGVTGLPQIQKMVELNVGSFDSTRPTMAAAFFQVFYSDPFRTFLLDASKVTHPIPRIQTPLPCDCPVCRERPEELLIPSPRKYMKLRSLHNYYHLMKTIRQIQQEKRSAPHAVPDVLWS